MSTSYERCERIEVLRECLATISGQSLWLETKAGEALCFKAGVLANNLLLPKYDSDLALDEAEKQYKELKSQYIKLKKGA
jgi:hypothetical protein